METACEADEECSNDDEDCDTETCEKETEIEFDHQNQDTDLDNDDTEDDNDKLEYRIPTPKQQRKQPPRAANNKGGHLEFIPSFEGEKHESSILPETRPSSRYTLLGRWKPPAVV